MVSSKSKSIQIYFVGICGTGMASLAVLLKLRGYLVRGSDNNVFPPMSEFLADNNIKVHNLFSANNLEPKPDLVVIGNALSRGNPEVEAILEQKLPYISMAELLKEHFIRGKTSLVVTGTHGKTTTSSLLAWVFESAKKNPGFMIGGIAENFGASCRDGQGSCFITEGDEYDTAFFDKRSKFLHYLPDQLIINNIEFDHADIFESLESIEYSFRMLLRLVPEDGVIVANGDDPTVMRVLQNAYSPVTVFGKQPSFELFLKDIFTEKDGTRFTVIQNNSEKSFFITLHGEHNVYNALGVLALARHNHIDDDVISEAFATFQSVKRRMELRGEISNIFVYDDFAHHPTAVLKTLKTARSLHSENRLIAAFEPRSNTSVQNMMQTELEEALSLADRVLLSKPHRMNSIPESKRLNTKALTENLTKQGIPTSTHDNPEGILKTLKEECRSGDTVMIMSNGAFGNLHQRLLESLKREVKNTATLHSSS